MEKNLIKESSLYKMLIPTNVEQKIRQLLFKIYNTEWSGILFYKYEGSFDNNDFKVICQDILPLDIGNSVFTSFEMSPTVISYMAAHDLLDCQIGLIHSHHSMETFFSSTDISTLATEGMERNNFVSLIVNNAGTYSAAVTWKVEEMIEGTKHSTLKFFGNYSDVKVEAVKTTSTNVHYAMLDVEIEDSESEFTKIISDLKKSKQEKKFESTLYKAENVVSKVFKEDNDAVVPPLPSSRPYQSTIQFDKEENIENISISKEVIDACVSQLLTLSLTSSISLPIDNLRMEEISDKVNTRIGKRFEKEVDLLGYNTIGEFTYLVIQSEAQLIENIDNFAISDVEAALAEKVNEELEPYEAYFDHLLEVRQQLNMIAYE